MESTRHLHKNLRSYCMILPSPNQQVTQFWTNSISATKPTKITRSKFPDIPAHSRQTWFRYKSQPSRSSQSLHHIQSGSLALRTANISSPKQLNWKSAVSFQKRLSCSLYMQLLWFQARVQNCFVCKSLSSNSPTELCYWNQVQVPTAAESTFPHHAYSCFFRIVPRNIFSTFCAL